MKKRGLIIAILAAALFLSACSSSGKMENEYIKIDDYSDISVSKVEKIEATDSDVDAYLKEVAKYYAQRKEKSGMIEEGDIVVFNYKTTYKGNVVESATAQNAEFTINSSDEHFGFGFLSNLISHKEGDTFTGNYIMTSYCPEASMLYQTMDCEYEVLKVYELVLPEITDEFIAEHVENYTTVKDYREYLKNQLQLENDNTVRESQIQTIWQALQEKITVKKTNDEQIEKMYNYFMEGYKEDAGNLGMELSDYTSHYYGLALDEFENKLKQYVEDIVLERSVVEVIAKAKNITASDEEVSQIIENYVAQLGYDSAEKLKEDTEKKLDNEYFYYLTIREKVFDKLIEECTK